ncbi:MAG: OmpA family protein [Kiloniellales bacterium]|nr:OmpA family protein [Kiloniellales bacterium]
MTPLGPSSTPPKPNGLIIPKIDGGSAAASRISESWLITFTDLVALLITFFVMLFSMSQVEERQWQNLTKALSDDMDTVREVTVALPSDDLSVEAVETLPGVDLDYLATLLGQNMEAEEQLAGGLISRLSDRLVVSLPADLLFALGSAQLDERGEKAAFALGGLLRHVNNRVEIIGHADPRQPSAGHRSNWELSLDRAIAVAAMLRRAGLEGALMVRGQGDAHYDRLSTTLPAERREQLARRVDVIVHDDSGELEP